MRVFRTAVVVVVAVSAVVLPGRTASTDPTHDPTGEFTPLTPARILDTRTGLGRDALVQRIGPDESFQVQVAGRGGVPDSNSASAVVLNATAVEATASSYLTVWPAGSPRPLVSNLNYGPGETAPNLVTVALPESGALQVYNAVGHLDVVFDVVGYYSTATGPAGSRFQTLTPSRLFDTRDGHGGVGAAPLGPGETQAFDVTGAGGVPDDDVTAVVMNVTVTEPTAGGYLTVHPGGAPRPLASNLNFTPGTTRPNLVTVGVGTDGTVDFFNPVGDTHVLADVVGYYSSAVTTNEGRFISLPPQRVLDSRGSPRQAPWGPGETSRVRVAGTVGGGAPGFDVGGVLLNVTVTDPTTPGFLTLWPADQCSRPLASNLNFLPGQTVPNLVIVGPSRELTACAPSRGFASVYNAVGSTHVVADVFGYFTDSNYRIDPTYAGDGAANLDGEVDNTDDDAEAEVLPDGTVVMTVILNSPRDTTLRRISPDGALDEAFTANLPSHDVLGFDVDEAGRIVLVERTADALAVRRLLPDGRPDASFDGDGYKVMDGWPSGYSAAVEVDHAGRIVAMVEWRQRPQIWDCAVTRLLPDGSIDPGFAGGLPVHVDLPYTYGFARPCHQVVVRHDDSVLAVAGPAGVAAIDAAGVVDPDFSVPPTFLEPRRGVRSVVELPDGKLAVGGTVYESSLGAGFAVARVDGATGALDPTFGTGGVEVIGFRHLCTPACGGPDELDWMGLEQDGSLVAGGHDTLHSLVFARWSPGADHLDVSFGIRGQAVVPYANLPGAGAYDMGRVFGVAADGAAYGVVDANYGSGPHRIVRLTLGPDEWH